ncbi:hypothetical protein N9T15_01465 [Pelagibacteraceae bacterium]|nr:hypothetical protein [Pelagibacteraceae bacterium]
MEVSIIKKFIVISFFSIIISRLIPHPPNFTSTIAIAFYLPALFGAKYIIVATTAFIVCDLVIGLHPLILFTWLGLILVGLISQAFTKYYFRVPGVMIGCLIFFFVSNFGVWIFSDMYSQDLKGLSQCYIMGLPFLENSLIGSLLFSLIIESIIIFKSTKNFIRKVNINF